MKKNNKRTTVKADDTVTPLTDYILSRMGRQGAIIRRRLKRFYRQRSLGRHLTALK